MKKKDDLSIEKKEENIENMKKTETSDFEDLGLEEIKADSNDSEEKKSKGLVGFLKSRKPDFWYRVVIGVCMVVFVFAAVNLVLIFMEYSKAEQTYEQIEEDYVTYEDPEDVEDGQSSGDTSAEAETGEETPKSTFKFSKANVDFAKLQKKNKDVIGWIQFETFSLSYPIVHDSGNNYYLTHTVDKKENKSGAIYVPAENSGTFNDTNTVIFGHNMKNGTMFGLLGRYKEKSYYELNKCFYIYTPVGERKYQIFSVYIGDENGSSYSIYGSKTEDYGKFLQSLKKNSLYETGVTVSKDDTIVTLSTCVTNQKTKRLIIHAKQIQ